MIKGLVFLGLILVILFGLLIFARSRPMQTSDVLLPVVSNAVPLSSIS